MTKDVSVLTGKSFDEFVKEGIVVVDFWAEWCGPCRILGPIVDEVSKEMKGKVKFGKVDVDAEGDLAQRFQIMSIPTLLFFKKGKQEQRVTGLVEKDELEEVIKGIK